MRSRHRHGSLTFFVEHAFIIGSGTLHYQTRIFMSHWTAEKHKCCTRVLRRDSTRRKPPAFVICLNSQSEKLLTYGIELGSADISRLRKLQLILNVCTHWRIYLCFFGRIHGRPNCYVKSAWIRRGLRNLRKNQKSYGCSTRLRIRNGFFSTIQRQLERRIWNSMLKLMN